MAGNYIVDVCGLLLFLTKSNRAISKAAVQTWGRLRHIFLPEQCARGNLLEQIIAGAWSGPLRLIRRNDEKS